MKGTIIANFANVKTMDGVPLQTGYAMQIGDYAFGVVSGSGTDLTAFDHFFRADGARIELGELCKAGVANMRLENVEEPNNPPPTPSADYIYFVSNGITRKFIPE